MQTVLPDQLNHYMHNLLPIHQLSAIQFSNGLQVNIHLPQIDERAAHYPQQQPQRQVDVVAVAHQQRTCGVSSAVEHAAILVPLSEEARCVSPPHRAADKVRHE